MIIELKIAMHDSQRENWRGAETTVTLLQHTRIVGLVVEREVEEVGCSLREEH